MRTYIHDYQSAVEFLRHGCDKTQRRISTNTSVHTHSSTSDPYAVVSIRYYNTDIVEYYADGTVRIDTGGYHSIFTSKRINQYQDRVYIYQRRYIMHYIECDGRGAPQRFRTRNDPTFERRLTVGADGTVTQ